MGQAKQSVFLAIFRKIILLVPLALLLPHWIGVNGIFIAEPISDATSGIVAGFLFYATYRKIRRDMVQTPDSMDVPSHALRNTGRIECLAKRVPVVS